jgi:hypothetical protein
VIAKYTCSLSAEPLDRLPSFRFKEYEYFDVRRPRLGYFESIVQKLLIGTIEKKLHLDSIFGMFVWVVLIG